MKIEVGKTYKDQNGTEWYVECCLKNPSDFEFPYLASLPTSGGTLRFSVSGWSQGGLHHLQPNKVKRKGWVKVVPRTPNFGAYVWGELISENQPVNTGNSIAVPIEWEEDE